MQSRHDVIQIWIPTWKNPTCHLICWWFPIASAYLCCLHLRIQNDDSASCNKTCYQHHHEVLSFQQVDGGAVCWESFLGHDTVTAVWKEPSKSPRALLWLRGFDGDWSTSYQGSTNKIDQVSQVVWVFYLFYRWVWLLFSCWMHMWCTCYKYYAVCIFRVVVRLFIDSFTYLFLHWQKGKENVETSGEFQPAWKGSTNIESIARGKSLGLHVYGAMTWDLVVFRGHRSDFLSDSIRSSTLGSQDVFQELPWKPCLIGRVRW